MKTYNIYILDDSKIITEIMKRVITSLPNVNVVACTNTKSFFQHINKIYPDLIFLDYYLAEHIDNSINGEDIFRQIKHSNPHIPIILLTGLSDTNKLNYLKDIGFTQIIHKDEPEIFNIIISSIQSHLNKV